MLEMFLLLVTVLIAWVTNTLVTGIYVVEPLVYHMISTRDPWLWRYKEQGITILYNYHDPWRLDSWFGFKHWFYPFKVSS